MKALIPLAASGEVEATADLARVTMPVLLMAGSQDSHRPLWGVERVYRMLPRPLKSKAVFIDGGSDIYCIAKSDIAVSGHLPEEAAYLDSVLWDTRHAHDLINHLTTAFLLDVLKGDPEAHKALLPEAVRYEGVQYTTTWK